MPRIINPLSSILFFLTLKIQSGPKKVFFYYYYFNHNFKVGHEPWTCVNPLHLANPCYQTTKLVSQPFCSWCLLVSQSFLFIYITLISFLFKVLHLICWQLKLERSYLFVLLAILLDWICLPLFFQLNNDKNLSESDMDLDDDVLYNFMDASSQLVRDNGDTPWKSQQEKYPLLKRHGSH